MKNVKSKKARDIFTEHWGRQNGGPFVPSNSEIGNTYLFEYPDNHTYLPKCTLVVAVKDPEDGNIFRTLSIQEREGRSSGWTIGDNIVVGESTNVTEL